MRGRGVHSPHAPEGKEHSREMRSGWDLTLGASSSVELTGKKEGMSTKVHST